MRVEIGLFVSVPAGLRPVNAPMLAAGEDPTQVANGRVGRSVGRNAFFRTTKAPFPDLPLKLGSGADFGPSLPNGYGRQTSRRWCSQGFYAVLQRAAAVVLPLPRSDAVGEPVLTLPDLRRTD
jgi:hypothetical protein